MISTWETLAYFFAAAVAALVLASFLPIAVFAFIVAIAIFCAAAAIVDIIPIEANGLYTKNLISIPLR